MKHENSHLAFGFEYVVETVREGVVIEREVVKNLVPVEGMDHILSTVLKSGVQVPTWYVGLFKGDYTPSSTDTMLSLPSAATEATEYSGGVRRPFTPGAVAGGAVSSGVNRSVFEATAPVTVYGGFLSSSSVRGGTTGTLLSVVRFSTPKVLENGSELRVSAGITLASA